MYRGPHDRVYGDNRNAGVVRMGRTSRHVPGRPAASAVDGWIHGSALADLALELASWLDTHAAQKPRTAADLDEASQSTCTQR